MSERFSLNAGSQHQIHGAVIGLMSVGVRDAELFANVAVGTAQGRHRENLRVGESMPMPGVGRLTLVDARLGTPSGGAAQFQVEGPE